MYQTLKNIIYQIVPKRLIFEHEETLRSLYSSFYRGDQYQCNVCNKKLRKFIGNQAEALCPNCGSLRRNRRLWFLLETEFLVPNSTVLDFSPSRCLYRKMKKIKTLNYKSTDLSGDFIADFALDITNLKVADTSYDLIICYHILEHITDDNAAMRELYRVMKPGAKALIQTPYKSGEIYEDFAIVSEEERLIHFGQKDHVRIYSVRGLKERLEKCGFDVEIRAPLNGKNKYHFDEEEILIITKP